MTARIVVGTHALTRSDLIDAREVAERVREHGYVHVREVLDLPAFRRLAADLGHIVAEEVIELRDGGHAYVAKPGPVPLHTDQAQVEIIGWLCRRQDELDGASVLLDSRSFLDAMDEASLRLLRRVRLACPPVAGGPPSMAVPVLRATGRRDLFFCSPWLDPVGGEAEDRAVLRQLWSAIQAAAASSAIRVRLAPGEALFIDNQRVMHGRDALPSNSHRRLHRAWVITRETAALE